MWECGDWGFFEFLILTVFFMTLTTDIYQRIAGAKVYIDNNFHAPIDLEQVSQQAFLSRFHFHRLFKQVYKKTPHQYITYKRIEEAKAMLAKEGISISDVCNHIGYESLGSFSSLFRKQNGCSPQYYRKIAWLKKKLEKEQPKRFIPHCFFEQYKMGNGE
jgi:AraC-like DNA-binding protein